MHPKLVLNLLQSQSWPWILIFLCSTLEGWDHKHVPPFQIYMERAETESMLGEHSATCHISSTHRCTHAWVNVVSVPMFVYPCTCGHEGLWRAEANVRQVIFNLHLRFWGRVSSWTQSSLTQLSWTDSYLPSPSPQVWGYRHAPLYPAFCVSTGKKTRIFMLIQQGLYQQPSLQYHPSPSPKGIIKSQRGESEQKKWRDMPCCWHWNRRTTSRRLQGFQQWRKSRAWAGTLALPTFSLALSGGRARLRSCRIIKHVCCFNTTWW